MADLLPVQSLTSGEQQQLKIHVQKINSFLDQRDKAEQGILQELSEIEKAGLYRDHGTMAKFIQAVWGHKQSHAYQLKSAAEVYGNLSDSAIAELPEKETQVRPLTPLEPAQQAQAWNHAVTRANGQPTAKQVEEAVEEVKQKAAVESEIVMVTNEKPLRGIPVEEWESLHGDMQITYRDGIEVPGKKPMFNRTNDMVEWALWTWNPVTGCEHNCPYCYARDIANRFYPEKFEPVFHPERIGAPDNMKVPEAAKDNVGEKNVFVCSMADLFGKWVPQDWIDMVLKKVEEHPEWNFLFLTKFPQRLSEQKFPPNAWVGTSVDHQYRVKIAEQSFAKIKTSRVKWLSCEPIEERLTFSSLEMFDWIVLGGRSRSSQLPEFQPEWEWVEHLVSQAREAGCMVYMKPNLKTRPREYPIT